MAEPIVILDHNPLWPELYQALHNRIDAALGSLAARIEHIGSTAVPGLAAKPIIDIIVVLHTHHDLVSAIEALSGLGYRHEGDLGIKGREAFATPSGYSRHDHHLYVCTPDWRGYEDQIAFRDYLRAHSGTARAYGRLKRALAASHRDDRRAYSEAKSDFVNAVLRRARREDPLS